MIIHKNMYSVFLITYISNSVVQHNNLLFTIIIAIQIIHIACLFLANTFALFFVFIEKAGRL